MINNWCRIRAACVQGVGTSGKGMGRDECEQVIGRLFYDGLLGLDMGYTAYATNAYLKLSPHGTRLLQGMADGVEAGSMDLASEFARNQHYV